MKHAARKEARTAGKSKKEIAEAGHAALKLSDSEKAEMKEINQARGKLGKEINQKKMALLTDEQKALIKKPKKEK